MWEERLIGDVERGRVVLAQCPRGGCGALRARVIGRGGIDVVADLERRILALEDAHDAAQSELADLARANRLLTGLLLDVASPARKVIAFIDGLPEVKITT